MRERTITKKHILPETVLKKVREGYGNKLAFGSKTYGVLLEELVATDKISQEKAHKALLEGGTVGRALSVLFEVRAGNYSFPNTGTHEGKETFGQELLEHVAAGRVTMAAAKAAIREGNSERLAYLLDQVEDGWHDILNPYGMTRQHELLKFIRLGLVSASEAARAIRAGYRMRADRALERVRNGEYDTPAESGQSSTEDLMRLVRLGFVRQEDAHLAFFAGNEKLLAWRRAIAADVLDAVSEGRYAHPFGSLADDPPTFGEKLKELVADGAVDEEEAASAFIKGRQHLMDECKRRSHHVLDGVAKGRSDLVSFSFLTFGQELGLLVESGAVSREKAAEAERKGAEIKSKVAKSGYDPERDSDALF